jgi:hypothetical protein
VLKQLLESIDVADSLAPHSWAVTLFANGFRLNVGSVEVFTVFDEEVRLFLFGSVPASASDLGEVFPGTYRSVPQPHHCFCTSVVRLGRAALLLQSQHLNFVRTAAVTSSGQPRRTPYAAYHSPGLYSYAKRIASADLIGAMQR